ncbi:hypothetical protein CI102_6002 [Trichoderma harzianum]|uniref:Uncharacterized protein n=1 Tax=Trichoderma harzianum CBS 226.95 TaxID=983964 RepID=A0A2T4A2B6_TRIHA|nr:hypothetical protein M431DRAFT_237444 [Trichoderma harzianum CBS 226.95]PKK49376.1 hypothetical protein CI102_6002 [Trichoderma harzianum]PTB51211.1 hypothetical protein M431DRAFT_237444 [Trichoderma harzianum CBS 226.95]
MYFSNPCHRHTNSGRPCFAVSPAFCITTGALPIPHTYSNPLVSRLAARATLRCNLTDCLVSWQGDEMLPEPQCDEISNPGVLPPKGILSQHKTPHSNRQSNHLSSSLLCSHTNPSYSSPGEKNCEEADIRDASHTSLNFFFLFLSAFFGSFTETRAIRR